MRKPPDLLEPPSTDDRQGEAQIVLIRRYRLLTPLFGGGVRPKKFDTHTPVRGSTIRGQLRFWWRATQAGRFANATDLKAAEDAIWGSTQGKSSVSVAIVHVNKGQTFRGQNRYGEPTDIGNERSVDSYAAFPLRAAGGEPAGEVRERVSFTLRLEFPGGAEEEVRAAVWAWDTFGGIGARTRRGFGALQCDDSKMSGPATGVWQWLYDCGDTAQLRADVDHFVQPGDGPEDLPRLSRNLVRYKLVAMRDNADDPIAIWRELMNRLRNFRQSRGQGRQPNRPGRSHWPEPDVIRERIGRKPLPKERAPLYTPFIDKFPRAAFGLPIIFEFKDVPDVDYHEPRKTVLEGANHGRLASPLILRPIACADGYVGLVVVLEGRREPPGGVVLKDKNTNAPIPPTPVAIDLTGPEAAQINTKHSKTIGTDILQSFLDSL